MSQLDKRNEESLSAMMDNEADDLELRRILNCCEQTPELLQTWERYNLARSVLNNSATAVSPDFSKRIAAEIEQQAIPTAQPARFNFSQSLTKLAIAASVAVVFTFAVQTTLNKDAGSAVAPALVAESSATASLTAEGPLTPASAVAAVDPVAQQRLRDYIESMRFDEQEPVRVEHIQDSPLYHLVNELEVKPLRAY